MSASQCSTYLWWYTTPIYFGNVSIGPTFNWEYNIFHFAFKWNFKQLSHARNSIGGFHVKRNFVIRIKETIFASVSLAFLRTKQKFHNKFNLRFERQKYSSVSQVFRFFFYGIFFQISYFVQLFPFSVLCTAYSVQFVWMVRKVM